MDELLAVVTPTPSNISSGSEATKRMADPIVDAKKTPQIAKRAKKAPKRRGGAEHTRTPKPTSLEITPRRTYFPIFTSNHGCRSLGSICYRVIQSKDYRLAQNVTELQLQYVLSIAWTSRLVQCSNHYGYNIIMSESPLKQAAKGIQLPNVLAQYVESIGKVDLATGASIVPVAGDYATLFPPDSPLMMDPVDILIAAERPVPNGDWPIDREWIVQYNEATSRASRSGIGFRTVDNKSYDGRLEMLVSYVQDDDMLTPYAPQRIAETVAHLGAIYRFRDYAQVNDWFGENKELLHNTFLARPVDPLLEFSEMCVASFSGATIH